VLGDRLAAIALENGWRGVVINGAIRDSRRLSKA
jgi:regulator of ribonuclease activity A